MFEDIRLGFVDALSLVFGVGTISASATGLIIAYVLHKNRVNIGHIRLKQGGSKN